MKTNIKNFGAWSKMHEAEDQLNLRPNDIGTPNDTILCWTHGMVRVGLLEQEDAKKVKEKFDDVTELKASGTAYAILDNATMKWIAGDEDYYPPEGAEATACNADGSQGGQSGNDGQELYIYSLIKGQIVGTEPGGNFDHIVMSVEEALEEPSQQ